MFADCRRTFVSLLPLLAACAGVLLLGGCRFFTPTTHPQVIPTVAGEITVPFTTLALNEWGMDVEAHAIGYEPRAFLLSGPEQVEPLRGAVNAADLALLQQVDWAQRVVIGVFRGYHGSTNYPTIVERIVADGDRLVVYTQFWVPPENMLSAAVITAPYHLVEVRRDALPSPSPKVELQWYTVVLSPPFQRPAAQVNGSIPFQTIDRWADAPAGAVATGTPVPDAVPAEAPTEATAQLVFLNSPEDLSFLASKVTPETMARLQEVDWKRFAVIALLRGTDPACAEPVEIIAILASGGRLSVRAELTGLVYGSEPCTVALRPYQVVQVSRLQLGEDSELSLDTTWATPTPTAK